MTMIRNELVDVAARAKRRFPDYEVDAPYRVCLPVYELQLKVTEVIEEELSTAARYVLQLSDLAVTQPAAIGKMLGISQNYVATAAAELLEKNLVAQSPARNICITEAGRQVLREGWKTRRPRSKQIRVPYDHLTRRILDLDARQLLDRDEVRKNGVFIPPTDPRRPRLSNIRIDEVRDYERFYGRQRDKVEILEVSEIKNYRLKYRNDVILVKMDAANEGSPAYVAYQAQQYLEEESALLQRLAERGKDLVPEDLKVNQLSDWIQPQGFSEEESELLQEIDNLDHEVTEVERAVAEATVSKGSTQDDSERVDLEAKITALESDKAELEKMLEEGERKLRDLSEGKIKLIRTEEHRHLLLKAIADGTSELTLVSAWIDPYAFDDEVCRQLAAAVGRGVKVRIAWGLGVRKRGAEASRNREKGNAVLSRLRDLIPGDLKGNLTTRIAETHEKFIICDERFCAWGSFNWLSYRGERDNGYRRETSSYSERPDDVAMWKAHADELFKTS